MGRTKKLTMEDNDIEITDLPVEYICTKTNKFDVRIVYFKIIDPVKLNPLIKKQTEWL